MRELTGDLFSTSDEALCITTNGFVRRDGAAVMGRGVAAQAARYCPAITFVVGGLIRARGNAVHQLTESTPAGIVLRGTSHAVRRHLFTLPVKHHWRDQADLALIERSLTQLVVATGTLTVSLPRPGCGNGRLSWDEVRPLCSRYLDDRFTIIERASGS